MQSAVLEAKLAAALAQIVTLQEEAVTLRQELVTLRAARAKNAERQRRFRAKHRNVTSTVRPSKKETLLHTDGRLLRAPDGTPCLHFGPRTGLRVSDMTTRDLGFFLKRARTNGETEWYQALCMEWAQRHPVSEPSEYERLNGFIPEQRAAA